MKYKSLKATNEYLTGKTKLYYKAMNKTILLAASALTGAATAAMAQLHTNIVLINLDDAGYGDFSYNGAHGYTTPNIDRMAAEGVQFTHFLAAQPISGASRAGLLTGCYPNRVGFAGAPMPNSAFGIHPDEMTMGELLKQKDYSTAIFGKWHLGDSHQFLPLQNGFDEYYGLPHSNDMWPFHPQQGSVFDFPDLPTIEGNKVVGYNTDQSQFTTDYTNKSIDFIKRNQNKPFFLYLAHSMPHVPLAVSDKFEGKSQIGLYGDPLNMTGSEKDAIEPAWEFHDLQEDPYEDYNAINDEKYQTVIAELKEEMVRLREELKDRY